MPKYAHLKSDDDESLDAISFSTSSTSLADSFEPSTSPTLVSYTTLPTSPPPSPSPNVSSNSGDFLWAERVVSASTANGKLKASGRSRSESSAEPDLRASGRGASSPIGRKASLPSSTTSPTPCIETMLLNMAKAAMAPCKIQTEPKTLEDLLERREQLMLELIKAVGNERANILFTNHVRQWNFLLIYAEEDATLGENLRNLLMEGQKHVTVAGPWEAQLGDNRLDFWQKLIDSSTVILVLLSRALFRDEMLDICFPGTLARSRSVVPLFVEPLEVEDMSPTLRPIVQRSGEEVFGRDWDAKRYVQSLHTSYNYDIHYGREVILFERLLENIKSNLKYV